jgi:hypothetical protein
MIHRISVVKNQLVEHLIIVRIKEEFHPYADAPTRTSNKCRPFNTLGKNITMFLTLFTLKI